MTEGTITQLAISQLRDDAEMLKIKADQYSQQTTCGTPIERAAHHYMETAIRRAAQVIDNAATKLQQGSKLTY